jgi:hypothetical protein
MNMVETDRMIVLVEATAKDFSTFDKMAVRAFLYRALGQTWEWVGRELGFTPRDARQVGKRGEHAVNRAVAAGKLDPSALAAHYEALVADFDPEADPEV